MPATVKITAKRITAYLTVTFAVTYSLWGFLMLNPNGLLPSDSPQYEVILLLASAAPGIVAVGFLIKWRIIGKFGGFFRWLFGVPNGLIRAAVVMLTFFAVQLCLTALLELRNDEPMAFFGMYFLQRIADCGLAEIGWRGVLQPAIERRRSFAFAAIVTGLVWTLWYLPQFLYRGAWMSDVNILCLTAVCVIDSFLLGAMRRLGGSVFSCSLFGAWLATMSAAFILNGVFKGDDMLMLAVLGAEAVFAAIAAEKFGKRRGV